jgi:hypothetical protein
MARIDASLMGADVVLGDATAFTVIGTVRVPGGLVSAGFVVRAQRISDFDGDSFLAVKALVRAAEARGEDQSDPHLTA